MTPCRRRFARSQGGGRTTTPEALTSAPIGRSAIGSGASIASRPAAVLTRTRTVPPLRRGTATTWPRRVARVPGGAA